MHVQGMHVGDVDIVLLTRHVLSLIFTFPATTADWNDAVLKLIVIIRAAADFDMTGDEWTDRRMHGYIGDDRLERKKSVKEITSENQ